MVNWLTRSRVDHERAAHPIGPDQRRAVQGQVRNGAAFWKFGPNTSPPPGAGAGDDVGPQDEGPAVEPVEARAGGHAAGVE